MVSKKQLQIKGFSVRGMILALKGFGLSHGLIMRTMEKLGVPISYNLITDTMNSWKNDQLVGDLEFKKYLDLMELRRTDPDAYYKKLNCYKRDKLQMKKQKWKNKAFSLQNVLNPNKNPQASSNNSLILSKSQKKLSNIQKKSTRHEAFLLSIYFQFCQHSFSKMIFHILNLKESQNCATNSKKKMDLELDSDFETFENDEQDEDDSFIFNQKSNEKPDFGNSNKFYDMKISKNRDQSPKILSKFKIISKKNKDF